MRCLIEFDKYGKSSFDGRQDFPDRGAKFPKGG